MVNLTGSLIYGPAYLDTVITISEPIAPELTAPLDQSLPIKKITADDSRQISIISDIGDCLNLILPANSTTTGGEYYLREAILSRRYGDKSLPIVSKYSAESCIRQLGGMGAGYAKAVGGRLRVPLGDDNPGDILLNILKSHNISVLPTILSGYSTDTTLLIQSKSGDKLAMGLRDALLQWQPDSNDYTLINQADCVIFCGAPNRFMTELLLSDISTPVICAPSMRNIDDSAYPLYDLVNKIDYLAMNALEWKHLSNHDKFISEIPLITITDGARGCDIYIHGKSFFYPALPHPGPVDTNRAGETYASTMLKAILHFYPQFPDADISEDMLSNIAKIANKQAHRQLDITSFNFPPDDWIL